VAPFSVTPPCSNGDVTNSTVCVEIDKLSDDVDALVGLDGFTLSSAASIIALESVSARLDYLLAKVLAEFDDSGEWGLEGAKTPGAWLETRCRLSKEEARHQVRRGRALVLLPLAAQAFSKGEIGAAQFDALIKVRTPVTEDLMARDEAMLVGFAKEMKHAAFLSALALWAQRADPDGAKESEVERRARRDVYLAKSLNGMYLGGMKLDEVSGTIVAAELERLEALFFDEDWAGAKERLGREPKIHELTRTSAQRRADALVEMSVRSAAMPADARRPEPLITFVVGYETMYGEICRIQGGPVVTPATIFEWLDGSLFERIVFAPGQRAECSIKSRFFIGATRRVIEVRDQECTHEYCDLPAEYCEIDHIVPSRAQGPTEQANGRVHCGFHNRLRNHGPPESGGHGPEPGDST
jgi:hypothetical protein